MVDIKEAPGFVMSILLIALLAAIGVLVLNSLESGIGPTDGYNVGNETLSSVSTSSNTTLIRGSISNMTNIIVTNASADGEVITDSNYTLIQVEPFGTGPVSERDTLAFQFQLNATNGIHYEGQDLNISYSGVERSIRADIIANGTTGTANITEQLPVVGVIIGVAILIGVVVLIFLGFRKETF